MLLRPRADAGVEAQGETRAQLSHPYYRAAFVLTGDPRDGSTGQPN
jgi:CHAT domain-containing protein